MVSNSMCNVLRWSSDCGGNNIIAVKRLKQMSVQSSFKHNIPRELIIHSCNLDLGKTIGQGNIAKVYLLKNS